MIVAASPIKRPTSLSGEGVEQHEKRRGVVMPGLARQAYCFVCPGAALT
jgi:hypothetical protein